MKLNIFYELEKYLINFFKFLNIFLSFEVILEIILTFTIKNFLKLS